MDRKNGMDRGSPAVGAKSGLQRFSSLLWRYRWALVVVPGLAIFSLFFLVIPEANPSDAANASATSKFLLCTAMGVLVAMLFAFAIAALYSVAYRKLKWLVAVVVFPPLAFIFFFHG